MVQSRITEMLSGAELLPGMVQSGIRSYACNAAMRHVPYRLELGHLVQSTGSQRMPADSARGIQGLATLVLYPLVIVLVHSKHDHLQLVASDCSRRESSPNWF